MYDRRVGKMRWNSMQETKQDAIHTTTVSAAMSLAHLAGCLRGELQCPSSMVVIVDGQKVLRINPDVSERVCG